MKIHGVMAISSFPDYADRLKSLASLCDKVYIRFDASAGDPVIMRELHDNKDAYKIGGIKLVTGWSVPEWRQDCLELVEPCDILLCPDQDEEFDDRMAEELKHFYASDKKCMMFDYEPLVTDDNRIVNDGVPYPPDPHCKAYKWAKDISYFPYHGDGKIAQYRDPACHWKAITKIKHYCCYTKEMEESKQFRSHTPKGKAMKAVTLIGFGPSSDDAKVRGEIWSLNNADEVFDRKTMMRVTRIFQMHMPEKVLFNPCGDQRMHIEHLNEMGKRGHRIIMQKKHDDICGSEAYPLNDVMANLGYDIFCGSPAYMLAMAIHEGYTHIYCYGFDQSDWEHTVQRANFATWCTYAMGKGIKMGGRLTWMDIHTKKYGYDYGPEWDDYQNKLMWFGHPFEATYKIPSRAAEGKFFKKGGK